MHDNQRPLSVTLTEDTKKIGRFSIRQWHLDQLTSGERGPHVVWLQLSMTERAAYRFNLRSDTPQLFVRAGFSGDVPAPEAISASQEVAAGWMDGEQQVFEAPMPMAIQVWIESYLARHGEAPVEGRKKKRKGAGRARELPTSRRGEQPAGKTPETGQTDGEESSL
ncbi:DUF3305 domain-containing protein [Halomonas sp. BLK-85]